MMSAQSCLFWSRWRISIDEIAANTMLLAECETRCRINVSPMVRKAEKQAGPHWRSGLHGHSGS